MGIKFENSPVCEIVISAFFDPPLLALRNEHVGLFWSRIRNEFPAVNQRPPYGSDQDIESDKDEFFPMPRFMFIAESKETKVLQLQKGAFMLNWNCQDTQAPHFTEDLKPVFDKYFQILVDFAHEDAGIKEIGIGLCELDYLYVIRPGKYWRGPHDTMKVLPSFSIPKTGIDGSTSEFFKSSFVYSIAEDMSLKIGIRGKKPSEKSEEPELHIDIATRSERNGPIRKDDADDWFKRADDAISACFANVTSKIIQQEHWKKVEGDS